MNLGVPKARELSGLGTQRDYLLKHFDTNRDKHISKADGETYLANGDNLTFPVTDAALLC